MTAKVTASELKAMKFDQLVRRIEKAINAKLPPDFMRRLEIMHGMQSTGHAIEMFEDDRGRGVYLETIDFNKLAELINQYESAIEQEEEKLRP